MKIESLNLTTRSYNILKRANINDTDELTSYSRGQILGIRCSNEEVVRNIEAALHEVGLSFSPVPNPVSKKTKVCAADLADNHKCFVERYPEPLQNTLKDRGFHFLADFTRATKTHIAAIPGMTPEIFKDISEALTANDLQFAETDNYHPDVVRCYAEHFPEPLQSSLKKENLLDLEDFTNIPKSYLAALPGMTPEYLRRILEALEYNQIHVQD